MKIIATADVHLGMKFSGYGPRQAELAGERFRALERVVEAGNGRNADLLIVAGDLFHRVGVAAKIVERAAAILDRFTGAAIAVLPGNHDYRASEGDRLWSGFRAAAGDRTLVLDRAGAVDLSHYDLPVTLLVAPCDAQHGATHRLAWATALERPDTPYVIGVAHGSIDGLTLDAEGHYFPMERQFLASLPADLWLIGHTHRRHDERDVRVVVPGTPEPDGFDCPAPGCAALITLSEPSPSGGMPAEYEVQTLPTGRYRFVDADVALHDPEGALSAEELHSQVLRTVPDGEALVRLTVTGTITDGSFERWNAVRELLLEDSRVLRVDDDELQRLLGQHDVDRRYAAGSYAHRLLSRLVRTGDHDALAEALSLMDEVGT